MKKLISGILAATLVIGSAFMPVTALAQSATSRTIVVLTDYDLDATTPGVYAADLNTGTGTNNGIFRVSSFEKFTVNIYVTQLAVTGGIEARILCRASGDGNFQQIKPVLADGTVTPSYVTLAAVGGWFHNETGDWHSCKVHLQINSADDGGDLTTNLEKVNIRVTGR